MKRRQVEILVRFTVTTNAAPDDVVETFMEAIGDLSLSEATDDAMWREMTEVIDVKEIR